MGTFSLGSPGWLWPCVALGGLLCFLWWKADRRAAGMPAGARFLSRLLKLTGLALLALCLVDLQVDGEAGGKRIEPVAGAGG